MGEDARRRRLREIACEIEARLGARQDWSDLLRDFQALLPEPGPGIEEILRFLAPECDGNYSIDYVVERCLLYRWPKPRLSRDELVALVEQICAVKGSEAELHEWLHILQANVPDPGVADLIYYSKVELTPEEIVDRALAYRVVGMPPPGDTPLMWAARVGDADAVRKLLGDGADLGARSADGKTALTIAREAGHPDVEALLVQAGAADAPTT